MKSPNPLHFKTCVLLLFVVVFGNLGNLLLKTGMKGQGELAGWTPVELFRFATSVMRSEVIWLGIASLLIFFAAQALVLSWADYTYVQPTTSFAYGTAALLGHFVLGEAVSKMQWMGIIVICMGVFVVGRTPPRTTEAI
jgi:drug/metabolite transporter (DMT)-like permease